MADKIKVCILLDHYGVLLSEKQKKIMECYFYDDLSLSEISENEGITRQGVRDILKRCEIALTDYDEKLKLIEKNNILKNLSLKIDEDILNNNRDIKALCEAIDNL